MTGRVYFVGAGPGSLDLLTVRAVRVLQQADVVLHDALVPHDFAALLSPAARVINVGKRCGQPGPTQDAVNALLIRYARDFRRVVRLKSGDPSVFGRLGEEMQALQSAGIEFEIVPGITAALAAAATARITLTDRRLASSVTFVTASLAGGRQQDWSKHIRNKSTLVIYMPGPDYGALSRQLMSAGASGDLACTVVVHAGSHEEAIYTTTLSELPGFDRPPSPSIVIVGAVARELDPVRSRRADEELLEEIQSGR